MGFLQLNHVQTYQGQVMNNRYFYNTTDPITISHLNELAALFETEIQPLVNDLQFNTVANVQIDVRELEGVLFTTLGTSGAGANGGEASPSWNALSFKLQRGDARTKSGGKRIGGLSEANIIGNIVFPDPTFLARIQAYADAMDDDLIGIVANYNPTLIKFDPVNPGVILNFQPIVSAAFTKLSTQNTRKP